MANLLSPAEIHELDRLETILERGLRYALEAGQALVVIQQCRLYRATHDTFEDYCAERWQMTRARAYQLIDMAEVAANLSTLVGAPGPTSERQTRPLSGMAPEDQREIWQAATATTNGQAPSRQRVEELAAKATQGTLTSEEFQEIRDEEKAILEKRHPRRGESKAEILAECHRLCRKLALKLPKILPENSKTMAAFLAFETGLKRCRAKVPA